MKTSQRSVTKADKILWDLMATIIGCIACRKDGNFNPEVSIHHVHGRTAPGCHKKVLPLCGPHHQQDDTDKMGRIAVHPWKSQWEAKYGNQDDLIEEVYLLIGIKYAP